ncbi:MAG: Eco57I restriction-modification methylase domain-containing protein, partial [Leptospiraceae bacterium]|nr:Eco57I restriction-modification methylase domain-containing protein [Leptospiraceae bacterium]
KLQLKYNELIYNKHQIDNIKIEDKPLREILLSICDTNENEVVYQFDQIPVDILGSIYERFLGKTLNIHPEKKRDCVTLEKTYLTKDTGIYYTPDYVVDFICENTIGKLFDKKTPQQIKDIKIIDIACGSGRFLVGAYSYLINWYENFYNENPDKAKEETIELRQKIRQSDGTFRVTSQKKLTLSTRRNILKQHIFGVDIDNQAVEVTQMSLFLKMLEENYDIQLEFEDRENILPSLTDNIACGNTLIDNTFFISKENKKRLKPFNWDVFFPDIIKWEATFEGERVLAEGFGFDIIIGNPPYVKQYTNNKIFEDLQESYIYRYYEGKMDYWYLFACQAIDLLKKNGLHSYIATSNWNTSAASSHFREKLLNETKLLCFVDFLDYKVFQNAEIQTMIYVAEKKSVNKVYDMSYLKFLQREIPKTIISETLSNFNSLAFETNKIYTKYISQINIKEIKQNIFTFNDKAISTVLTKIIKKSQFTFSEREVAQGIIGGPDKAFIIENIKNLNEDELKFTKIYYTSSERYVKPQNNGFIFYIKKENFKTLNMDIFPNIFANIMPYKDKLKNRRETKLGQIKYFQLHWPREERFFSIGEKIVCAIKTKYPKFYLTENSYYGSRALNFIKTDRINNKYLITLLNSNISYFYLYFSGKKQGNQLQIDKGPLLSIPIANPIENNIEEITKLYDEIMLSIEEYDNSKSEYNKKSAKTDIKRIDKRINQYFYNIYELSKNEITTIENNLPPYEFLN